MSTTDRVEQSSSVNQIRAWQTTGWLWENHATSSVAAFFVWLCSGTPDYRSGLIIVLKLYQIVSFLKIRKNAVL